MKTKKIKVKPQVKARDKGIKVKTQIKAGGRRINHSETLVSNKA